MKPHRFATVFALALVAGCAATGPATTSSPSSPAPEDGPLGSPFGDRHAQSHSAYPLLLDRGDLSLGTTVQFARMPSLSEISDLAEMPGLRHVVITLASWPAEFAPLQVLESLPEESDAVIVLPGYPPSRGAAEAWNLVHARLRLVMVVRETPPSAAVVSDLNNLRALERVIAELDVPARTGFERLQRPLSFRVLRE